MTRLDHALYAVAAYMVVVLVGVIMCKQGDVAKGAAEGGAKDKSSKTAWQMIKEEPIRLVQLTYNLSQVRWRWPRRAARRLVRCSHRVTLRHVVAGETLST
jgi:hypothetical protein